MQLPQKTALEKDNKYMPIDAGSDVAVFTKMTGGGEIATVDFIIIEPVTYEFLCTFPAQAFLMK